MKLTPLGHRIIKTTLSLVAMGLLTLVFLLIVKYVKGLDERLTLVEQRPVAITKVVLQPTASPSATLAPKRVQIKAVIPTVQ